jgi:hypothetical protein
MLKAFAHPTYRTAFVLIIVALVIFLLADGDKVFSLLFGETQ